MNKIQMSAIRILCFACSIPMDPITDLLTDPGKRVFQVWDGVSRAEVAVYNAALARCLACLSERMSVEEISEVVLLSTAFPP